MYILQFYTLDEVEETINENGPHIHEFNLPEE